MDIGAGKAYPSWALSNFARHPFVLDGVEIESMEGFLQALKFPSIDIQKNVCTLAGKAAKFRGKKRNWWRKQELYWQGVTYPRQSQEYQDLLDRAYQAMFDQSDAFKRALIASKGCVFTHSIGKNDPTHTVLTTREFCSRIQKHCNEINDRKIK